MTGFAGCNRCINGAPNNARISLLGIADDASFVDVFAREADVLCRSSVPDRNGAISPAASANDLAAILRGVVFVGETALCLRFNFQRVRLSAICCRDKFVVRALSVGKTLEFLHGPGLPDLHIKADQPDYDREHSHERPSQRPTFIDRHGDNPNAKGDYSCRD